MEEIIIICIDLIVFSFVGKSMCPDMIHRHHTDVTLCSREMDATAVQKELVQLSIILLYWHQAHIKIRNNQENLIAILSDGSTSIRKQ